MAGTELDRRVGDRTRFQSVLYEQDRGIAGTIPERAVLPGRGAGAL